jgi:uncharacterized protein (DUF1697 family)
MVRGINLGSRKRVAMGALRELVSDLGHLEVQTYVQSGNVVFRSAERDEAQIAAGLERAIARTFGLDVTVVVRSAAKMKQTVAGNPFKDADPAHLHVTFLAGVPSRERIQDVAGGSFEPDELRVVGADVYLRCPNGYGRSKLSNDFLERKLGTRATTRNWRSVTALATLSTSP